MGWLFSRKKKEPKVPFPTGKPLDETSLQLPSKFSKGKVIEPEEVKAAAGLEEPLTFPEELEEPKMPELPKKTAVLPPLVKEGEEESPLYIKVDAYQRILGELENLKGKIDEMKETSHHLEESEFNEENNFAKLKRLVRSMHDHMLLADKIIFKT